MAWLGLSMMLSECSKWVQFNVYLNVLMNGCTVVRCKKRKKNGYYLEFFTITITLICLHGSACEQVSTSMSHHSLA